MAAIVYYGFLLSFLAVYWYLLGYFHRKMEGRKLPVWSHWACLAVWVVLALSQVFSGALGETTAVRAAAAVARGEAAAYEEEYQERMNILMDDTVKDAILPPFEHQPDMLYVGDFSTDPSTFLNQKAATYFHKDSILVSSP